MPSLAHVSHRFNPSAKPVGTADWLDSHTSEVLYVHLYICMLRATVLAFKCRRSHIDTCNYVGVILHIFLSRIAPPSACMACSSQPADARRLAACCNVALRPHVRLEQSKNTRHNISSVM